MEEKPTKAIGRIRAVVVRGLYILGVLTSILGLYLAVLYFTLPDVSHLVDENPSLTSYIKNWAEPAGLDPEDFKITSWAAYSDIAPLLLRSVVYSEDTGYYRHHGVEWELTRKMAWRFLSGRKATGASTIPQQLARNLFLDGDISVQRKIREIMLALKIEQMLSKERILEIYLNVIEWGEGVWGITQAADHYFEKTPADLNPFECIFLPGILPAPRRDLSGGNLYRVTGTYRRLCFYLLKEDKMTIEEWVHAKKGVGAMEIALMSGRSLKEALAEARAVKPQ